MYIYIYIRYSAHTHTHTYISILIFLAQGKGFARVSRAFRASPAFVLSSALLAQTCSKSPSARPEPLRAAQNRSERAQGRSEPPRAFAQSCSRNRSGSPRAAQNRQERSLKVAQSRSESLRARPELLRAAQTHPEQSLRAVAQSCSRKRSGSSVSRALCISDAQ